MVITLHNLETLVSLLLLSRHPSSKFYQHATWNFWVSNPSQLFLEIGRNYVSVIVTIISNITELVSHNVIWDTKTNFLSFPPLHVITFQKFWVPEYFLYQLTLLIKIHPKGGNVVFTSFFSQRNRTWRSLFDNWQQKKLLISVTYFLLVKIMLVYAKIQQLT